MLQLTPLHWGRVDPGQVWNAGNSLNMGKVWFTVSASVYDEKNEPTKASVVARLAAITAAALLPVNFVFAGVAVLMGVTSIQGVSKAGVYADGKTLTVRGRNNGNGSYLLEFADGVDQKLPADMLMREQHAHQQQGQPPVAMPAPMVGTGPAVSSYSGKTVI